MENKIIIKKCRDCKFYCEDSFYTPRQYCFKTEKRCYKNIIPNWCPLREVSEKLSAKQTTTPQNVKLADCGVGELPVYRCVKCGGSFTYRHQC
ncbi:MAG TPA: hypothetical protein VMV86_06700 [Methanosarcinales archaeon]|nr:hypothetical protein [Methanosarcinales archaeon]